MKHFQFKCANSQFWKFKYKTKDFIALLTQIRHPTNYISQCLLYRRVEENTGNTQHNSQKEPTKQNNVHLKICHSALIISYKNLPTVYCDLCTTLTM